MSRVQALLASANDAIRRFSRDESGASAIEYAIIAVGISVVIVASVTAIGSSVKTSFTSASNGLN